MKLLTAVLAIVALFMLAPRLSYADSDQTCYNHPSDHSDFCYCYRHPKECNGSWRSQHPDWNRHPSWYHEARNGHNHHNDHPNGYNDHNDHPDGYNDHPNDHNGEHHQGSQHDHGDTYQQQHH